jgi:hypothetical protein
MARVRDKRSEAALLGLLLAAAIALLSASAVALAGQDQLKGGTVNLRLQSSKSLKLKPTSLGLAITGGAVDPVDGSGIVQIAGGFKAKRGKGKTKVKGISLTLGANGGQGTVSAKVGKDFVNAFGKLAGGSLARSGWGATISNVRITLARKGARALTRALSPRKGKGARKSAGGVKAGQQLGTIVSLTTDPLTVEVVPGSGNLVLHTNAMGAFVSKLPQHCIDPLPTGSPPGVAPIAPATTTGLLGTDYVFPVTGGTAAPDFTAGELLTGGGQTITKNSTLPGVITPSSCPSTEPPTGTQVLSTDLSVAFEQSLLRSIPTLPTGPTPRAPLGAIDFSTGTRSVDPAARTLTISGATVTLAELSATILNQIFPNRGPAGNDFAAGDAIGTIDVTGVKLR